MRGGSKLHGPALDWTPDHGRYAVRSQPGKIVRILVGGGPCARLRVFAQWAPPPASALCSSALGKMGVAYCEQLVTPYITRANNSSEPPCRMVEETDASPLLRGLRRLVRRDPKRRLICDCASWPGGAGTSAVAVSP